YRVDPSRPRDPAGVRLEPSEVAVVTELFASYLEEGQSLKRVTTHLIELQIPTPSGRTRWNQATVRGILTNPVYTGIVYLGRSRPTQARQRHSALQPIGRDRGGHTQTSQEKCPARTIPVEQLDELVWQDVCLVLTHPQQIAEALAQAQGGHWLPQALQARRENLRKARVSVEQQLERLTDAYLAKVLDLDEF